jgi:UDP-N-acetylmuramate: L-alanyl-gamma-D-glutamyl-meso-diaminopimelate ligase
VKFQLTLPGRMNALDAALAAVAARQAGVSLRESAGALRHFPGVEGRLEIIGKPGLSVIYADEAYHPIALRPLLDAVKKRHPRRRIIFIFEPRYTGGRLGMCQKELPDALAKADVVIACPAIEVMRFDKPFDHKLLCRDLRKRGLQAVTVAKIDDTVETAPRLCRDGDIVIVSFSLIRSELTDRLVQALQHTLAPGATD